VPQVTRGSALLAMQYQVLARKWRPQNFSELVGQPHVSRSLLNALKSDRVAHAFLFSGPRGSGKTTTARLLAKALNCHQGSPGEPCGRCPACVEIAAGNCMDVIEIDAASNRGIDEIRDLRDNVRYQPARDRRKIFIIDEVHMLTPEAFNALLKTLEEPPAHIVFIMATTEYHKIPATILSRCQHYVFKLIPYELILERLSQISQVENFQISRNALEQIVFASGGSMRDAMSALDQVVAFSGPSVSDEDVTTLLSLIEPSLLGDTARAIAGNDAERILRIVSELVDSGRDLQNFCRRLVAHLRNLMVVKSGVVGSSLLGVPDSLVPDLREQAALFSAEDLLRLFESLVRTDGELRYATQQRFCLEMGLIELAQLSRLRSLEDLIADFQRLAKGETANTAPDSPAPAAASPPGGKTAPASRSASVHRPPSAATMVRRPRPAPGPAPAAPPPPEDSTRAPHGMADPRRLLLEIAAAVQKESLEPILQSLSGARLQGGTLALDLAGANDFIRRQLSENLEAIAAAASAVVGSTVDVVLEQGGVSKPAPPDTAGPPTAAADVLPDGSADPLERAKSDPVVRAFLEVFPGPVKAEKDNP
jgi:DNA polymerase-3 subunit gamma/tau